MKLPKFPVYKKKDGRKKPHCFSVPPPLAGDKEKFFYAKNIGLLLSPIYLDDLTSIIYKFIICNRL